MSSTSVTWDCEEWKSFNNVIEKREACYVSPKLLRNMTTLVSCYIIEEEEV